MMNNRERSDTGGSMEFVESQKLRSRTWSRDSSVSGGPPIISSPMRRSLNLSGGGSTSVPAAVKSSQFLRRNVDWIQRQPVPLWLVPTVKRVGGAYSRVSGSPDEPTEGSAGDGNGPIFCIKGLDRVVFGTMAAADCVVILGIQPPRYLFYMISGAMCDVFQLAVDLTLHFTILPDDAALCWMISFCVSILARHTSHRYLVFGDYVPNYWQSLGRMYAGYSFSIVVSTVFNYVITEGVAKVSHYVAYVFTLLWTGLANYFILKRIWKMGGPTPPAPATTTSSTSTQPKQVASPSSIK